MLLLAFSKGKLIMITIYAWIPPLPDPGHVSMQVGTSTYISFFPCENAQNEIGSNRKTNKKISSGISSIGFATSESYEEDCSDEVIGRKAEEIVVINKLPEEIIIAYWNMIQSNETDYDYNLFINNCASIVGTALEYAYGYYYYKSSPIKKIADFCLNIFPSKNIPPENLHLFLTFLIQRSKREEISNYKEIDSNNVTDRDTIEAFFTYTPKKVIARAILIKSLIKDI